MPGLLGILGHNHNVRLGLACTFLDSVAGGIWGFVALSVFIYLLQGKDTSRVGYAEGIQGLAQAAAAIPAGYLADRFGRAGVLRAGGVVGLAAAASTLAVVLGDESRLWPSAEARYAGLCASLALFGVNAGITNPALEALFADSVKTGERSETYSLRFMLSVGGFSLGPVTSAVLFSGIGNEWTLSRVRVVMLVGLSVNLISIVGYFFFRDDLALGTESEGLNATGAGRDEATAPLLAEEGPGGEQVDEEVDEEEGGGGRESWEGSDEEEEGSTSAASCSTTVSLGCCVISQSQIPLVLVLTDLVTAVASGMTVKFFPIFFQDRCGFSPVLVNAILASTTAVMAVFTWGCQLLSRPLGRLGAAFATKIVGVGLLVAMALMRPLWTNPWAISPVFLARTALMNCGAPLIKSVAMDYVPKKQRGKWNALDSVTQFGWSGSAVLGGVLLQRYGFGVVFLLTAATQLVGNLPYILIHPIVPAETKPPPQPVRPDEGDDGLDGPEHGDGDGDRDGEEDEDGGEDGLGGYVPLADGPPQGP